VLEKTLGVPLFQEQAMQVAIVCAGFTPGEADQLRRSMATFKFTGGVSHFRDKMIAGMVERGYTREFSEQTFSRIEGFGSYGFPESHAASFALIAYASAWLKCHHPDVFCCALLNAQPMGFYAPGADRARRGAAWCGNSPVCINTSVWDCMLEEGLGWSPPPPPRHGPARPGHLPRQCVGSGGPDKPGHDVEGHGEPGHDEPGEQPPS
jgi:error-prone DNA polymerase